MLRNKDYKNCRLSELKVLSTVSTGYCEYWLLMSTGCCEYLLLLSLGTVSTEYWVVGSSHWHISLLHGYYLFCSCFLGYPVYPRSSSELQPFGLRSRCPFCHPNNVS